MPAAIGSEKAPMARGTGPDSGRAGGSGGGKAGPRLRQQILDHGAHQPAHDLADQPRLLDLAIAGQHLGDVGPGQRGFDEIRQT